MAGIREETSVTVATVSTGRNQGREDPTATVAKVPSRQKKRAHQADIQGEQQIKGKRPKKTGATLNLAIPHEVPAEIQASIEAVTAQAHVEAQSTDQVGI